MAQASSAVLASLRALGEGRREAVSRSWRDGVDDIESGNGENFVASGRVDLDGDGAADLDLIKEHMTTNQNVFDDDEWI